MAVERLIESTGTKLKKSGKDLAGCCPFHEDDTASVLTAVHVIANNNEMGPFVHFVNHTTELSTSSELILRAFTRKSYNYYFVRAAGVLFVLFLIINFWAALFLGPLFGAAAAVFLWSKSYVPADLESLRGAVIDAAQQSYDGYQTSLATGSR